MILRMSFIRWLRRGILTTTLLCEHNMNLIGKQVRTQQLYVCYSDNKLAHTNTTCMSMRWMSFLRLNMARVSLHHFSWRQLNCMGSNIRVFHLTVNKCMFNSKIGRRQTEGIPSAKIRWISVEFGADGLIGCFFFARPA